MSDPRPDLELRRLQTKILVDFARIRHTTERLVDGALKARELAITPAQANALLVLVNARRPLSQAELARELGLSEVTVGRFVRAMEEGGWIERARDEQDSRVLLLRPTARAREDLPRFVGVSNGLLDQAFAGLDPEDLARIDRCLTRILGNLEPP